MSRGSSLLIPVRSWATRSADQPDVGTMVLGLLDPSEKDRINPAIEGDSARGAFTADTKQGHAERAFDGKADSKLVGSVVRTLSLAPGESQTVTFVIAWHFPNLFLPLAFHAGGQRGQRPVLKGRYYATKFDSARAVAVGIAGSRRASHQPDAALARHLVRLDAALLVPRPHAAQHLHAGHEHRLSPRRWSLLRRGKASAVAQARAPTSGVTSRRWAASSPSWTSSCASASIIIRKISFNPMTGTIGNRGEVGPRPAADGQAGTILRTYRDYLVSPDDAFLKRNWPSIKTAVGWLFTLDSDGDGILDLGQSNTLDAIWYGQVPWISGLALAAVRAGEEMAKASGDTAFAQKCKAFAELGKANFTKRMWNGEYFEQIPDPTKLDLVGSYNGCEIDQVLGQSWAFQDGLGRVLPEKETKSALQAIWKYNFATDVGPFREKYQPGRWFAMPGESGLLMCSWPRGDQQRVTKGIDSYFNECMNGFEHQVAGHMIWEGMVQEGLVDRTRTSRSLRCRQAQSMERNGMRRPLCALHGQLRRFPRRVRIRIQRPAGPHRFRSAPHAGKFQSRLHRGARLGHLFPNAGCWQNESRTCREMGRASVAVSRFREG